MGITDGVNAVAADYDTAPEAFEDFEQEWSANENFLFDFGSAPSAPANYDSAGTPEPTEDFEELWRTNEAFVFDFGSAPSQA